LRKNYKIFVFFLLLFPSLHADPGQEGAGLDWILSRARERFVTPEELDRLKVGLRAYENTPGKDPLNDSLVLEAYRSIATAYSANNHYRQSYETLIRYLHVKESILLNRKLATLREARRVITERERKDVNQQNDLRQKLNDITEAKNEMEFKQHSFKRNVSFFLILLSSVFALMLVGAGIRMLNLRTKIRQNRDRIRQIHRRSNIGLLADGLRRHLRSLPATLNENNEVLYSDLKASQQDVPSSKEGLIILEDIRKLL
jgi:hypothetical protein